MPRTALTWSLAACLAAVTLPAAAQPQETAGVRIEVSEDGLETAVLPRLAAPPRVTRGPGAPYGTVPDWFNDLRRQVGGLVVADVDGDSWNDLVVGVYNSSSFPPYDDWHNLIYFNTGGGALEASPSWISADQVSTTDVKVALIDDDSFLDVVAANGGVAMDPAVIYFGSAAGPATTAGWTSGESSWTISVLPFDLDHDGDVDLVTANQGNSQFDPFRPLYQFENVNGVLDTLPSWQSAETSIQNFLSFGDLDGDTWEDLAVSKWANFESGVYRNDGGTLETTPTWTTGTTDTDRGVAWANVDGDMDLDLALGHDPTQLYTNTAGSLAVTWSSTAAFFGHQDLAWEDVDLDGDPDLAEVHFSNGHVNLYLNSGGSLDTAPTWTFDSPAVGTAVAFGDIDGDGQPDLVVGNAGDPSIYVFYNQGDQVFNDGFESGSTAAWSATVP